MTREKEWELRKKGLLNVDVNGRLTKGVDRCAKNLQKKICKFLLAILTVLEV
jgi:hypothetical protein